MRLPGDDPTPVYKPFIELAPETATANLHTIEAGWARALRSPDVHAGAGEVAMTELLRDGMRDALDSGGLPWSRMLVVLPGTESRSRPEVLRPDGRTDIPILWIAHAIIECKRIAGADARLRREYVAEGIDRFRTGKYGANHAAAAAQGINRRLNSRRGKQKLRQSENLTPSSLVDATWAWVSCHPRTGASPISPIELHHGFLPTREWNYGIG